MVSQTSLVFGFRCVASVTVVKRWWLDSVNLAHAFSSPSKERTFPGWCNCFPEISRLLFFTVGCRTHSTIPMNDRKTYFLLSLLLSQWEQVFTDSPGLSAMSWSFRASCAEYLKTFNFDFGKTIHSITDLRFKFLISAVGNKKLKKKNSNVGGGVLIGIWPFWKSQTLHIHPSTQSGVSKGIPSPSSHS